MASFLSKIVFLSDDIYEFQTSKINYLITGTLLKIFIEKKASQIIHFWVKLEQVNSSDCIKAGIYELAENGNRLEPEPRSRTHAGTDVTMSRKKARKNRL